jgi:hypothetical protein
VLREDYAGSAACARCHAAEYVGWFASPMHRMTRDSAELVGDTPFDGRTFRFKEDAVVLSARGGERFFEIRAEGRTRSYRVTRVIGGHHREDYVGVDVERGGDEIVMPVSWLLGPRKLRYKGYSVMARERPGVRPGPVWSETCIFCHNTYPYLLGLLGAMAGPGAPSYQGAMVDALLPEARRWRVLVTDEVAMRAAVGDELVRIGGARPSEGAFLEQAIAGTRASFGASDLVELGVGCESCHLGSRAHASDPRTKTSFVPRASFLRVVGPGVGSPAVETTRACARCHQVLFSRYPYTWEGGLRRGAPGGSHINSGEARDFLLGGCASQLTCTACHDPHARDGRAIAARSETREGDAICTACHARYAGDEALRAHAHHDPAGSGGRCVACHMPKKNMSLEATLTRYHRIGSPTDSERVLRDRPLECALCHAGERVQTLVGAMERWWGKKYDRAVLEALYGSLDATPVEATLARGKPHEQATALFLAGELRERRLARAVAAHLLHEYPLVRFYAEGALEKILGRSSPLDLHKEDDALAADARAWLAEAGVR